MSGVAITEFSDRYYLLPNYEYRPYSGDVIGADESLLQVTGRFTQQPLVKCDGGHYWLQRQWGIPSQTIAVPQDIEADLEERVLLAKQDTAEQLFEQGLVPGRNGL